MARHPAEPQSASAYRARRRPLQLVRRHIDDGRALAGLVADPEQRIVGVVLAAGPQRALVLQRAPAAVRVLGAQTVAARLEHGAVVHLHLGHPALGHHVQIQFGGIEVHVRVDGGAARIHDDVRVDDGGGGRLDHHLLQVAVGGADEDDRVAAGARGRHAGQLAVDQRDGHGGDWLLAAQRRVHVQAAEVLGDGLQLLRRGRKVYLSKR